MAAAGMRTWTDPLANVHGLAAAAGKLWTCTCTISLSNAGIGTGTDLIAHYWAGALTCTFF